MAVVLAVATGCAGTDDSAPVGGKLVTPDAFESAVADPEAVTINVHVPDAGLIAGTDVAIPFDQLEARKAELPPLATPLAVYCRTGRMSAEAVETLEELGYRDIVELSGGMLGWVDSGRPLVASQG